MNIFRTKKIKLGNKVKINFVKDRPGHDFRYALDSKKINRKLKWKPSKNFIAGLNETVEWYIKNYEFFSYFSKNKFFKRIGLKI